MKEIIKLENIKRDFKVGDETVHALRGVSFTIYEGEFVTIMGTSGSGKSTLLNTLGCLDTPTSGEYYLDGTSVRTMGKNARATLRNRKIGFVFQNYNLLPKTTAVENVELPLMYNSSYSAAERHKKAVESLVAVGLGDRLMHKRKSRYPYLFRDTGSFPETACRGTYHHIRDPQPGDRPVQQPQHHAARRACHLRHGQPEYPERGRSVGAAAEE